MARSDAATPEAYLAELPDERRAVVEAVRAMVLRHLPPGYEETMRWGMLCYEVPLARYPTTYNGQPLAYVALAAQKGYYAIYLTQNDAEAARLAAAFAAAGKRLDMGKACVRFRRLDDLPLAAVGEAIAAIPPDEFIARHEAARAR